MIVSLDLTHEQCWVMMRAMSEASKNGEITIQDEKDLEKITEQLIKKMDRADFMKEV